MPPQIVTKYGQREEDMPFIASNGLTIRCGCGTTVAGKKIFTEGLPSEGVPACMSCHGEQAEGNGPIPRLAGQHQAYLARQLEAFASMARANEIMHENSKDLTPQQISEVTAYLATL